MARRRYGYTGQAWLGAAKLWHFNARMYGPTVGGTFMQPDPIGYAGGMNLYNYTGGDPVNYIDPLGLAASNGGTASVTQCVGYPNVVWNGTACINLIELAGTMDAWLLLDRLLDAIERQLKGTPISCDDARDRVVARSVALGVSFNTRLEKSALDLYIRGQGRPVRLPDSALALASRFISQNPGAVNRSEYFYSTSDPPGAYRNQITFGQVHIFSLGSSYSGSNEFDALLGTATGIFDANGRLIGLEDTFDLDPGSRGAIVEGGTRMAGRILRASCGQLHPFRISAGVGR